MTRCAGQGLRAGLGRWGGVQQTTIVRWVGGGAFAVWPLVSPGMGARGQAPRVSVDAQWRTSRGRWYAGCVVWEVPTALPLLAALLPARGPWAGRGGGRPRRQRQPVPQGLSTEG